MHDSFTQNNVVLESCKTEGRLGQSLRDHAVKNVYLMFSCLFHYAKYALGIECGKLPQQQRSPCHQQKRKQALY